MARALVITLFEWVNKLHCVGTYLALHSKVVDPASCGMIHCAIHPCWFMACDVSHSILGRQLCSTNPGFERAGEGQDLFGKVRRCRSLSAPRDRSCNGFLQLHSFGGGWPWANNAAVIFRSASTVATVGLTKQFLPPQRCRACEE